MKTSMITASIFAFTQPVQNSNPRLQSNTNFGVAAFVPKNAIPSRFHNKKLFSDSLPISTSQRLRDIRSLPDDAMDASEQMSDHPAFQACERSKVLAKMDRPDRAQLDHLNSVATVGINKIDKCITALKNDEPAILKRADLLFGKQVEITTLTDGLQSIKNNLERVRREGAYAVDTDIDECPTEAFTILQELPHEQRPFVIFLRGYFFNPPEVLGLVYKNKEDYQAHTLVHEATHLALRSHDVELNSGMPAYSPHFCMELLKEQPDKPLDSADSWAWLVN